MGDARIKYKVWICSCGYGPMQVTHPTCAECEHVLDEVTCTARDHCQVEWIEKGKGHSSPWTQQPQSQRITHEPAKSQTAGQPDTYRKAPVRPKEQEKVAPAQVTAPAASNIVPSVVGELSEATHGVTNSEVSPTVARFAVRTGDDSDRESHPPSLSSIGTPSASSITYLGSHPVIDTAVQQIVELLLAEQHLRELCLEAVDSPYVGHARFQRYFRRVLRLYAGGLQGLATTQNEKECATFVNTQAGVIAIGVRESLIRGTYMWYGAQDQTTDDSLWRYSWNQIRIIISTPYRAVSR
jgi:hypothetical protein